MPFRYDYRFDRTGILGARQPSGPRLPIVRKERMNRTSLRILFTAALALALLALAACSSSGEQAPSKPAYVSPYDWSGLAKEDGRYTYAEGGEVCSFTGIDVSEHQGAIDWNAVASDGIDFAFIRIGNRGATEGAVYLDERYVENMTGAREAGIPVGVYFFSQAITAEEALEEADFVLAMLGDAELAYPIVYDHEPVAGIEGRADGLSREQMTENALAFCTRIAEAGYEPMVYGNKRDIARFDLSQLEGIDVWFAEYGAATPSGQFDFSIWQYANDGTVAGVSTAVDLNILFIADAR